VLVFSGIDAQKISVDAAEQIAKNVFYENFGTKQSEIDLEPVYTDFFNEIPLYYVFNLENEIGFVIVSADERVIPVLGYSNESPYDHEKRPVQFADWMESYSIQIQYVIENQIPSTTEIDKLWQKYNCPAENFSFEKGTKDVSPLLGTIAWNQDSGWNQYCPIASGGPGGRCYAGCVATAAAQVMKFWNYPETGEGSHSYTCDYGTLSADFGATTYQWASMSNTSSTSAAALLIYHVGISVDMDYQPDGSGASISDLVYSFENYFKYKETAEYKNADWYPTTWKDMLIAELEAGRPMVYRGYTSGSSGHAFVCDGYRSSDEKFHFNWGWSGYSNGYYALSNLNPGGYDFTDEQAAVFGIEPDIQVTLMPPSNLDASLSGDDVTLTWDAPFTFGDPQEIFYADINNVTNLNWPTPERSTLFDITDFSLSYPAEITQLTHFFYEHTSYPWPDATFTFKIYDTDGSTLLYESSEMEAEHMVEITHTLSSPVIVYDDFYVAIVPVDASGHPSSTSVKVATGTTHSYSGSAGSWEIYDDGTDAYEFVTYVNIAGAQKISYNPDKNTYNSTSVIDNSCVLKLNPKELPKYSKAFTGYKVYRNDFAITGVLPTSTLTYLDDNLSIGSYTYCVKSVYDEGESECSNEETVNITVDIQENGNEILIYPNPTNDFLFVKSANSIDEIKIVDISGRILFSQNYSENNAQINLANIENGVYFIEISTPEGKIIKSFVKK